MHTSFVGTAVALAIALGAPTLEAQVRLPLAGNDPADRIDPAVRAAMDTAKTLNVLILGRTQLLAPVGGLDSFAVRNARADRRQLRPRVIADLKRIADTEQPAIMRALGERTSTRLWIINAVASSANPDEIRRLAAMDEVRFIYPAPAQPSRPQNDTGTLRAVLRPTPRPAFDPSGKRIAWYLDSLRVPKAWTEGRATGEGVLVASLDNGVNYLHPDLTNSIWVNPREIPQNGRDDDGNGYVDDLYGFDFVAMNAEVGAFTPGGPSQHGSVTSAIIVGDGTEGIVTGVAPRARLMALRGNGTITAPLAIQYVLDHGADVLNMSFSLPDLGNSRGLWRMMADHATAAGLVLAGGAGNFRLNRQVPLQHWAPKDAPSVISVGGVDSTLTLAPFSSMGPAEWSSVVLYRDYPMPNGIRKPDVVAFPGAGYPVVAYPRGYLDPNPLVRGNSLSGPQGSGVAALMLSVAPGLPAWRVAAILRATARDLGAPGPDNEFGAGLIDAAAAVRAAVAEVAGAGTAGR
ncbi:MAG TPA: S8 family serine peptidase [Gemmatimonadaceae bacterium]|nr:S8 family serine peptidase [Gemmatimonadaceae bacterium]